MPAPAFSITGVQFINELAAAPEGKANSASDASIGCPVRIEVSVEITPGNFAAQYWRINPALFLPPSGEFRVQQGVFWACYTGAGGSGTIPMTLSTNGSGNEESNRNLECSMVIESLTEAKFVLRTRMTMDLSQPILSGAITNGHRLLKAHRQDPDTVPNGYARPMINASVYKNTDRSAGFYIECVTDPGTASQTMTNGFHFEPYVSRWYGKGLPGGTARAELQGDHHEWRLTRNDAPVSNLSVWEKTTVRVLLELTGSTYETQNGFMVYLVREQHPNVAEYLTDYGSQGSTITELSVDGTDAGGNIEVLHPHVTFGDLGNGEQHYLQFKVGTNLVPGATYSIIVVANGRNSTSPENTFTNSFIYSGIVADALPPPVPADGVFTPSIWNYGRANKPNKVVATVGDRLRLRMAVDAAAYEANRAGYSYTNGFVDDLQAVSVKVTTPDGSQTYVGLFSEVGGVPSLSGTNARLSVVKVDPTYFFDLQLLLGYPNEGGNPDYSEQQVQVTWTMMFSYPINGDVHGCGYEYTQEITVNGWDEDGGVIKSVELFDAFTGQVLDQLCYTERILVRVTLDEEVDKQYSFRAYASPEPYGYLPAVSALQTQEEEFCSPLVGGIDQRSSVALEVTTCEFVDNVATFFLDASAIQDLQRWRIFVVVQAEEEDEESPAEDCCTDGPLALFIDQEIGQWYILGASDGENVWTEGAEINGARSWSVSLSGEIYTVNKLPGGQWLLSSNLAWQSMVGEGGDGVNPCTVEVWYFSEDGGETHATETEPAYFCGQFINPE
jgi:hypothetical protein